MKKLILAVLILLASICIGITISFAWFVNSYDVSPDVTGYSASAYFASGDGSSTSPYEINNARHLYNLAWLQYLGEFNKSTNNQYNQKYFKITADITIPDNMFLPPIGTDQYPFIGSLDGQKFKIFNLKTSNNKTSCLFSNNNPHPYSVTKENFIEPTIVGAFGSVGIVEETEVSYDKSKNTISGFNIINSSVETVSSTTLVGIIAGYVNGTVKNIGVYNNNIKFASGVSNISDSYNEKLSNYALIGDYNNASGGVSWEDVPSGGLGYGTSTDIENLYNDLATTDHQISSGYALPFSRESATMVAPSATTFPMALSSGTKNVDGAITQSATAQNIGYYVGSDIKVYNKSPNYDSFYYPNNSGQSYTLPCTIGDTTHNAPEEEVIDYLNDKGTYIIRLTGTQQLDISNEGGLVVVENGKIGTYEGKVLLPNRCIWVAPVNPGIFKFVCPGLENEAAGFRVLKLKRSTPKNYSTYFTGKENILEFNAMLLKGKSYYFEITVTQSDIDAGYEFAITGGDGYKPYISYVDIGTAGGGGSGETPTYNGTIENIDFIYSDSIDVSLETYVASNVIFVMSGTTTSEIIMYFKRKKDDSIDIVYYYPGNGNGITIEAVGSGSSQISSDSNCDTGTE